MTTLARCICALMLLQFSAFAQNLIGIWQGALQIPGGPQLRTVFKIETTEADKLKATLYSIDQGGTPIGAAITHQGSVVKIAVQAINGTYEGKLTADGNSIEGTWNQGGPPINLTLKRATAETAWTIPEPPARPKPMPANADPSFEVATIKPSKPGTPGKLYTMRGREFVTINTSVSDLLGVAYRVHEKQVIGAPEWVRADKFDILAKPDVEGTPSQKQLAAMLQKLLADRFQLKFHPEQKDLSVYALAVSKNGPKMNKSGDSTGLPSLLFRGLGVLTVRNATMGDFANIMQSAVLDRPVVDQTSLDGKYDFLLKWTPDETQFTSFGPRPPQPQSNNPDAPPDLFTAIQQQLGLKFESTKAPVDVLVIDKIEKPSEN